MTPVNKNTLPVLSEQLIRQRRDQLLYKISTDQSLPSLGIAISKVIKITSDGEESVNKLAKFILSDVGLTKEILNLANSVGYRNSHGTTVTTVSKAIFILGFDIVKTSALGMLMLECFSERDRNLYYELTHSLCSSIVARECISRSMYNDAEEASISALFKNIGLLLLASQAPEIYRAITEAVKSGEESLHHASVKQLGCSVEHFGSQVLQQWGMPESIVQNVVSLPPGQIKKSRHRSEWIKQVAAFSADASDVIMRHTQFQAEGGPEINFSSEKFTKDLLFRYGAALELDPKTLPDWLSKAVSETEQLARTLGMHIVEVPDKQPVTETAEIPDLDLDGLLPDELMMSWESVDVVQQVPKYASGKPHNARDLLLSGVMEMTQTISSGKFQLNDLVLQMLEILQGSLGFEFATASLKDAKSERYIARISIGRDWNKKQKAFNFSSIESNDLFHLSLKNNADLMIADASTPKIHQLRPEWHRTHFPDAKSMMILPLMVNKKPIGLIYAERSLVAPEGVPPDETALVKTMKGQLLAAMNR